MKKPFKKTIRRKVVEMTHENCDICMFPIKKCICQPFWRDFHNIFDCKIESINNPTQLRISTMTFGFKLQDTRINLNILALKFKRSMFARSIDFKKNSKKSRKNLDINYNFYNQCSIKSYIPHEKYKNQLVKVSIKIFHNGSFNVTGSRSIQGIIHVIRKIIMYLKSYDHVLIIENDLKITDVKISMINTDFSIQKRIRQRALNDVLNNEHFSIQNGGNIKRSDFDPDVYHGVKIKYVHKFDKNNKVHLTRKGIEKLNGEVTISVFNTGSVIITGGKSPIETVGAYKFINKIFEDFPSEIIRDQINPIKKKKPKKIYFKRIEFEELNKELLKEKLLFEKRETFSLLQRSLVEFMTRNHKKLFQFVLDELNEHHSHP